MQVQLPASRLCQSPPHPPATTGLQDVLGTEETELLTPGQKSRLASGSGCYPTALLVVVVVAVVKYA